MESTETAVAGLRGPVACVGISTWKRDAVRDFLTVDGRAPTFHGSAAEAAAAAQPHGSSIVVWATREPPDLEAVVAAAGLELVRMEDGFLRSVDLGARLVPSASVVLDRRGMYYDATRPSDLEALLSDAAFDGATVARARRLRECIVRRKVSKYNLQEKLPDLPSTRDRPMVFVPGQVEDDASIALGTVDVSTNAALLQRVRADWPDAFVVYKPHPDVDDGFRKGFLSDRETLAWADCIVREVSAVDLIERCDRVATMTSPVGFEALLRNRPVTTFGLPFYAGWGLTEDRFTIKRRVRALSLDELTAGVLLQYPLYRDPVTGTACTPEQVVERLTGQRDYNDRQRLDWASRLWLWRAAVRRMMRPRRQLVTRADRDVGA